MRYISCKLDDLKKIVLPIGYEGENDHTRVQVDAGEVFKEYPAAVPTLKVHGPTGAIYPAEVTRDGKSVIWDIKASDCAADGSGEAQFTFTLNNVIVKSCIAKIKVYRSIVGGSTPPDPVQDWIDDAEEVLDDLAAMDNIAKTAAAGDVGKALSPKTVVNGVVTEWQYVEPGAGTEDYTDLENKPSIGGVELSGNKTLEDLGAASASAVENLAGDVEDLQDDVSDVKNAIEGIEDELEMGGQPTTDYEIPSGYQSANYSNAAGTLQFKYTDNKLLLVKENGSFGEISTTNASLDIGSSLCVVIDGTQDYKFHYTYENENDANVAIIVLRCYQDNFSNNQGLWIYIPQGTGEQVVDIVALAEENEINLSSYKNVMIRAISLLEVQGATAKNARVTISGFGVPQIPEKRLDKIEDRLDILEDEIGTFATPINVENLYEKLYEDLGYIDTSTGDLYLYNGTYIEKTSKYIPVTAGEMLHYQAWASGDPHGRIGYYNSSKDFVSYEDIPSANRESVTDGYYAHVNKTVPSGVSFIRFSYYSFGNGKAYIARSGTESNWIPAIVDMGSKVYNSADDYDLKGINHRGYNTVAPENTIPAFILSAQNGFKFVETDLNFTSDDVPVLLHDTTINRTARNADGTELSADVAINSITYLQAQEYDFGIWKDATYAGTKIPKFEDFIILCKQLGLHPYIELKNDIQYTEEQILSAIAIVRKYGMEQSCTWISFALNPLYVVKRNAPFSRLGYIVSTITDKRITEAKFLRTQYNETFLDAYITNLTSELIAATKASGVTLETYNIDTKTDMLALDSYISGVTSNIYDYNKVVQKGIMPDTVSGSTPAITGIEGHRYICGECSTLSVVAPASGCIDVIFKSGSTATTLTVTSAKANTTIAWANGFDPSDLEADTTYELNILDGELGVACSWT